MSSWGCPHDVNGICTRLNSLRCDPGMRGCVLFGRFVWADESKNRPRKNGAGRQPEAQTDEDDKLRGPSGSD